MPRSTLTPDDPRHGTANGYGNYDCRCGPCTAAWNVDYAARVAALRAETPAADDPRHGTYTFYRVRRCRCERCVAVLDERSAVDRAAARNDPDHPWHGTPRFYGKYECRCKRCAGTADQVRALYGTIPVWAIATRVGISQSTVNTWVDTLGLERVRLPGGPPPAHDDGVVERFRAVYATTSTRDLMAEFGISSTTVYKWAARFGLSKARPGPPMRERSNRGQRLAANEARLHELWGTMSLTELAAEFDANPNTVREWARKLGLATPVERRQPVPV